MSVSLFLRSAMMLSLLTLASSTALGQMLTDIPAKAKDIGVDEKLGGYVPADLVFENELGKKVRLGELLAGGKPILLTLNYSGCPGLCVAQLDGLVRGVEELRDVWLGEDFQLVSISIDPRETADRAKKTKDRYTKHLPEKHDNAAWHFWTGSPNAISSIADSVGFRYTYDKANDRYNHVAMAVAISPKGKITRYLYDVAFDPATMKMALLEASEGKIGTPLDSFVLWCMQYDANENRYSADAKKLLSLAAGAFVLIVIGSTAPFWFSKRPDETQNVSSDRQNPETPVVGSLEPQENSTGPGANV